MAQNFFDFLSREAKGYGVKYISDQSFFTQPNLKNWPIVKSIRGEDFYVYHYTKQEGAFQILKNRTIRASDSVFLNDSLEIEIGRCALERACKKLEQNLKDRNLDLEDSLYNGIVDAVDFLTKREEEDGKRSLGLERQRAYTASFTTLSDDLSQWRGYAGESGVALGFSASVLATTEPDALLAPVIYGDEDTFTHMIYQDFQHLNENSNIREGESEEIYTYLVERYAVILPLMKSEAFKDESEWRLVLTEAQVDSTDAKWRSNGRYTIPFVELNLWPDFEKEDKQGGLTHKCLPYCKAVLGPESHPLAAHYYDHMLGAANWKRSTLSLRT